MAFDKPPSPPPLNIPSSQATVKVSIVNTTAHVGNIPADLFVEPKIPEGIKTLEAPCFSFLIRHEASKQSFLFDLGIRKDWENGPAFVVGYIKDGNWKVNVEKNTNEVLKEHGVDPGSINSIIWSHFHWDHTGDPATFPSSTSLIVGPGFKEAFLPGHPIDPEGRVSSSAFENRELKEISFDSGLKVGRYNAIDFFGDGSFYLLDSPGHAIGHMCGLARTTSDPPSFIFMGGDIAHHGGEFRPTEYVPIPKEIKPHPKFPPYSVASASPCPGHLFEKIHPKKSSKEPFYEPGSGASHDKGQAQWSLKGLEEFDANPDVFTVFAHDNSLMDVVEFFPTGANDWKEKGWKPEGRWRFLKDFEIEGE